jgi:fructose-specific component phosphotransferase system IIB-like protein
MQTTQLCDGMTTSMSDAGHLVGEYCNVSLHVSCATSIDEQHDEPHSSVKSDVWVCPKHRCYYCQTPQYPANKMVFCSDKLCLTSACSSDPCASKFATDIANPVVHRHLTNGKLAPATISVTEAPRPIHDAALDTVDHGMNRGEQQADQDSASEMSEGPGVQQLEVTVNSTETDAASVATIQHVSSPVCSPSSAIEADAHTKVCPSVGAAEVVESGQRMGVADRSTGHGVRAELADKHLAAVQGSTNREMVNIEQAVSQPECRLSDASEPATPTTATATVPNHTDRPKSSDVSAEPTNSALTPAHEHCSKRMKLTDNRTYARDEHPNGEAESPVTMLEHVAQKMHRSRQMRAECAVRLSSMANGLFSSLTQLYTTPGVLSEVLTSRFAAAMADRQHVLDHAYCNEHDQMSDDDLQELVQRCLIEAFAKRRDSAVRTGLLLKVNQLYEMATEDI